MRTRRKEESQSSWRFTMEHIGRELRKLYPPSDKPSDLHALFTKERERARATRRTDRQAHKREGDGD
jgi:hypothetical protein